MTYTLTYDEGQTSTETFETLDEALDRAADLAIEGEVIQSLRGPGGAIEHDLIDVWMYRKLDATIPNPAPRERHP